MESANEQPPQREQPPAIVAACQTLNSSHTRSARPDNPMAALIRKGAVEAGLKQGSKRAVTNVQRMINSLQWRQAHYKDQFYPLALESGKIVKIKQLQCGEITGLGTGATVWPAAHVLAKYLERRYGEDGLRGSRVVDLGSGTGVAGIVAATALGARETFLTDQERLLFLMRENADRCCGSGSVSRAIDEDDEMVVEGNGSERTGPTNKKNDNNDHGDDRVSSDSYNDNDDTAVHVLTYDWGMADEQLSPPLDVILVSDCVLPKLYPIEPLIDAIIKLSGPDTVTFLSYEHRHYQAFDPRRRFEELATVRGLTKTNIPQAEQHPIFSADDIEIWEVRRTQPPLAVEGAANASTVNPAAREMELLAIGGAAGGAGVFVSQPSLEMEWAPREVIEGVGVDSESVTMVTMLGESHVLTQSLSGAIGCYLWPSAVVMARHLVAFSDAGDSNTTNSVDRVDTAKTAAGSAGDGVSDKVTNGPMYQYPARAKLLELGSGVGLVTMAAALLGYDVVGTDKACALPLLRANVKRCLSSTRRKGVGRVEVQEYEWGMDARGGLVRSTGEEHVTVADGGHEVRTSDAVSADGGYDIVVCADCVYAKSSVEPLLATLCQVCDENTMVLMTNELRTAFDEFIRAAAAHFTVEHVNVAERDMVIDASSNTRPMPVTLKRLRRRRQLQRQP